MECGPGGTQSRTFNVTQEQTSGGCGCNAAMFSDTKAAIMVPVDASTVDTRACELPCCPESCEGSWKAWSQCEGPAVKMMSPIVPTYGYTGGQMETCCGGGTKSRRFEYSKWPHCNGAECMVTHGHVENVSCCETPCPVDCEGHWSEPGECCSSCGGGQQERVFIITQEAQHGGQQCSFKAGHIKHETCNADIPCPIDCEGFWAEWDTCTDDCGPNGTQTRHWIVTVEAEHGGAKCSHRDQVQLRACDPEPVPCPVDAKCRWTEYGECSAACFDTENPKQVIKTREWVEISKALHGGAECKDSPPPNELPEAECHDLPNCSIACEGHWGKYTTCDAEIAAGCSSDYFCGHGSQTKTYHITKEAQYGGKPCPQKDGDLSAKVCGDVPCPINCEGNWTTWTDCSSECGTGSQSRDFIIHVEAAHGGCECKHVPQTEHRSCNTHPCPIDCEGSWSPYGTCSQECTDCRNGGANGIKERKFSITVEAQHGGQRCAHTDGEISSLPCNIHCCPEDCEGSWSEYGECSKSCGNGVKERTYTITHNAAHGGQPCPYANNCSHTTSCNVKPCKIDCVGHMLPWTQCSAKCGGGTQKQYHIQKVVAQHGGQDCEYGQFQQFERECNTDPCPQNCLGSFGPWTACDAPCSGGTKNRTFNIFRPAAAGGDECGHAAGEVQTQTCNTHDCPAGYVCPAAQTCKYANGLVQRR